ncbi:MAG TPA: alpha/beta fold hydrolase [Blastocatellia bacterium]|nr:alpha/beta fold hydrolase [Blastocatellia bacterium]
MQVRINDTELFYTTIGQGRPLLLMHGIEFDHTYLRPWLDALGDVAQLIYYDHRGHGRSAKPDDFAKISHQTWIDDAEALRRHLGYERMILFGHSYGGFLAQEYALCYGDRLDGLILCDTAPAMDYQEVMMANAQARATPGQLSTIMSAFSGPVSDDAAIRQIWMEILPLYFHNYDPQVGAAMDEQMVYSAEAFNQAFFCCLPNFNTLSRLSEISTPILVLAGRHDWITPPREGAERLHEALPNSKSVIFENSGHFPFIEEHSKFIRVVTEWLANLPSDLGTANRTA